MENAYKSLYESLEGNEMDSYRKWEK